MNSLTREKRDTKEFRRLVLRSFGKGRRETQKEFRQLVLGEFFLAKGRQPLIVCAKSWLLYFLFSPFLCFFNFWGRLECSPCSYVSSSAIINSDLRSSLKATKTKETVKALDLEWIQATFTDKNSIACLFYLGFTY